PIHTHTLKTHMYCTHIYAHTPETHTHTLTRAAAGVLTPDPRPSPAGVLTDRKHRHAHSHGRPQAFSRLTPVRHRLVFLTPHAAVELLPWQTAQMTVALPGRTKNLSVCRNGKHVCFFTMSHADTR